MTCLTCPAQLTEKDMTQGCARCELCRKAAPGRPKVVRRTWGTVIGRPRTLVDTTRPTSSWWTDAPVAGFTAAAGTRRHG